MDLLRKAQLAKLSYESRNVIEEKLEDKNVCHIYVKKTDTEGFGFRIKDKIVFVFAGTNSLKDLWRDLSALPFDKYYQGYLHRGFAEMRTQIDARVIESFAFLNEDDSVKSIELIGHSLGAATAMIAADILHEYTSLGIDREITTFGCPNGWSKKARKGFELRHSSIKNYINSFDYVTWLIGIFTGRPGKDIKLKGRFGHIMSKYIVNISRLQK